MSIREAFPEDKDEIIKLYARPQEATGLPDPRFIPPHELGHRLFARHAIARYVFVHESAIAGHGMIEEPNPAHIPVWRLKLADSSLPMMEMGGAFVDPDLSGRGIWSSLLQHRMTVVRSLGAVPVSATWSKNEHVKKTFDDVGGVEAGTQATAGGDVSLYVFPE